jgi:cysteine desulfurase / selenocysteine lyase
MKIEHEAMRHMAVAAFDVKRWRQDFPILRERVHDRPLVYLDNGATTQKPQSVIDAESAFYARDNANVHRGVHALSQRATDAYEAARRKVQRFLNAAVPEEIVFVRGTTEAINMVEHHSNIVPWQIV